MPYFFSPLTETEAREICSWRYEGSYAIYNIPSDELEESVQWMLEPAHHYHAIRDRHKMLIGFCSFGPDGQVPGGHYEPDALDIGAGMQPHLTGQGRGADFLQAILTFGYQTFGYQPFRATIAAWNQRALRMATQAGFQYKSDFVASSGRSFIILTHAAPT